MDMCVGFVTLILIGEKVRLIRNYCNANGWHQVQPLNTRDLMTTVYTYIEARNILAHCTEEATAFETVANFYTHNESFLQQVTL